MMANKAKTDRQEEAYRVTILGRNVYVTDAMKNYALEKLSKIDRFHSHVIDMHVTMDIQKLDHSVVVVLTFSHFKIKVEANSTDMYASIDKVATKLKAQLRRWKDKIQDHHRKELKAINMHVNVIERPFTDVDEINADIEMENQKEAHLDYKAPKIIGSDTRPLKMLTTPEAVMKMELSKDPFLIFKGEEDQKLKVMYRRSDGHLGIVVPE